MKQQWDVEAAQRCLPVVRKSSGSRLGRVVACAPLLAQLAVAPILQAQDSTSRGPSGPRPNRVGIAPYAREFDRSLDPAEPPPLQRDASCIVRDMGIGLLAAGGAVLLVTIAAAPFAGSDKKELRRSQRKAFWTGLALGVAYTLIRLREPCDLPDRVDRSAVVVDGT